MVEPNPEINSKGDHSFIPVVKEVFSNAYLRDIILFKLWDDIEGCPAKTLRLLGEKWYGVIFCDQKPGDCLLDIGDAWNGEANAPAMEFDLALNFCYALNLENFDITLKSFMNVSTFAKVLSNSANLFNNGKLKTLCIRGLGPDMQAEQGQFRNSLIEEYSEILISMNKLDKVVIVNLGIPAKIVEDIVTNMYTNHKPRICKAYIQRMVKLIKEKQPVIAYPATVFEIDGSHFEFGGKSFPLSLVTPVGHVQNA